VAIILGFGNNPTITPHEANGLALLLGTIGTDAGLSLAAKLQHGQAAANGSRAPIVLTGPERSALGEAIGSFRRDRLPQRLLAIADALADDLDPKPR
jgi:hypothetical protein